MSKPMNKWAVALALGALAFFTAQAPAQEKRDTSTHSHSSAEEQIHKGYFEDSQIQNRTLADWQGEWQSVYPYLMYGTLDPVMEHKAESGKMSAEEYRAYYDVGYKTDVDKIIIKDDEFTFIKDSGSVSGRYVYDGRETLTYKKGNRGVRFIFKKAEGDDDAPRIIQFSDHRIAPSKADHFHLYWGDDRAAVLKELTNWPTYYPASLSGDEIVHAMMAH
ncbi:MAG: metal-binding protein ZinT [Nitratireductor sp.]|nr:metal-binding protein ZinT [Nitratireductor sp.]